jgi:hypothetical protein
MDIYEKFCVFKHSRIGECLSKQRIFSQNRFNLLLKHNLCKESSSTKSVYTTVYEGVLFLCDCLLPCIFL